MSVREFYFIFIFFASLFDIQSFDRGIRRAKDESSSTRQGLRMSTKNTGFRREFK